MSVFLGLPEFDFIVIDEQKEVKGIALLVNSNDVGIKVNSFDFSLNNWKRKNFDLSSQEEQLKEPLLLGTYSLDTDNKMQLLKPEGKYLDRLCELMLDPYNSII